jgi:Zn2+/Cd2+-exporting ATPase
VIKKRLILESVFVIISIILIISGFILENFAVNQNLIAYIFGFSFLIGGYSKAKEGILSTIKNRSLNVEILMIMAALGAFFVGEFKEGAILILIFSISGVLESYTTSKSEKALTDLLKLAPEKAILLKNGIEKDVDISSLDLNDLVVVKVGMQVPVDGKVINGQTSVNQSLITGEFMPLYKVVGDTVYAGSINIESQIIVETTKNPKESVVQKIVDFVKDAQEKKTKSQTFIDKFEKYYVYFVILLAILVMLIPPLITSLNDTWTPSYAFNRGIIVLVVGSPCALVASISPVLLSALSNGSRKRILIKGGTPLEETNKIKAVVFDKTGTLTTGVPSVVHIEVSDDIDYDHTMSIIYSIEKQSKHPLAVSITKHLSKYSLINNVESTEISGRGMEAIIDGDCFQVGKFDFENKLSLNNELEKIDISGLSIVYLIKNQVLVGYILLRDTLRENASLVIKKLQSLNIKTILLTGDHEDSAKEISNILNIDQFYANCLPEDKVKYINQIKNEIGPVMMIGDGINDAPALTISDVSIAMGSATDISLETSDVVIMTDNLEHVLELFKLSKRVSSVITQNVLFSTSVIAILLISNLFGIIRLTEGVLAHELSTILVILNSLRLLIK